jgi:uncharacterized protein (TIRG00374 family)
MKTRNIIPYLFTLLFILIGIFYFQKHYDKFAAISIESSSWLIALAVACLAIMFLNGIVFKVLMDCFQIRIDISEALQLSFVTAMGNYLLPYLGGMGFRGAYLKKRYDFPVTWFMSTVAVAGLLTFVISALFGATVTIIMYFMYGRFYWVIFTIFTVISGGGLIVLKLPYREMSSSNWLVVRLNNVINGWKIISQDMMRLRLLILVLASNNVLKVVTVYFAFSSLMPDVEFFKIVVISSMAILSNMINITPARIGVTETIVVLSGQALGFSPVISLSVAILNRTIYLILSFLGGGLSSLFLFRSLKSKK